MQVVEQETKTKVNANRNRIERTAKSLTRELAETLESEQGNSSGNNMQVYSEGNGQNATLYKSSEPLTTSERQINWSEKPNSVSNIDEKIAENTIQPMTTNEPTIETEAPLTVEPMTERRTRKATPTPPPMTKRKTRNKRKKTKRPNFKKIK